MRLIIFLFVIAGCNERSQIKSGFEGKPLPEFTILLPDSTTYLNTKDIPSGRPIVMLYFGPQCPFSRAQIDEIVQNINTLRNIQFYIFTSWPFEEMKDFYNYYHLDKYSNIVTGIDYSYFFTHYFKISGVPFIAIYGKNKLLTQVFAENIKCKQLREATLTEVNISN